MDIGKVYSRSSVVSQTGLGWLDDAGTFLRTNLTGIARDEAIRLLDMMAWIETEAEIQQSRLVGVSKPGQLSDTNFALRRAVRLQVDQLPSGLSRILLPEDCETFQSIEIAGQFLEVGRDIAAIRPEHGYAIVAAKLPTGTWPAVMRCVWWRDQLATRFWSHAMPMSNLSTQEDNAPLLEKLLETQRYKSGQVGFAELLGLICQSPSVTQPGRVVEVLTDYIRPVVVTDKESFTGQASDTPIVSVGDLVAPGDFLFDAVRLVDLTQQVPPSWLPALTIPPRIFAPHVSSGLTFINDDVDTQIIEIDGRPRIRFTIEGQTKAVNEFWAFVDSQTRSLGYGFEELACNMPRPSGFHFPAKVNPLRLLWTLRLRWGTSIVALRREPTPQLLKKLGLLRRVQSPWLTTIYHFDSPVPEPYHDLC